jgi:hypothetical protein
MIGIVVAVVLQLIFMLMMLFVGFDSWIFAAYAVIGVVVTGIYILIDLVKIITPGGISYDDYILGAIMLYVDLLRMFIYLLALLGKRK